jgi:hypothetical protein
MWAGEYPQPLTRVTTLQCPVVSGYSTGRLKLQDIPVSGTSDLLSHFTVENVGSTSVSVQLRASNSTGGPWTNVGSSTALAIGGRSTFSATAPQRYIEVHGTSGSGEVRLQIASKLRWDELGFSKTDASYPTSLWQPVDLPAPDNA